MKIAVVISGLARFPEQGLIFLERIIRQSPHDIDIFAGVWSIDEISESVASKVKRIETISYNIRNDAYFLLEKHNLTNKQLSPWIVTETHAGLISHMATCTAFKDELKDYDLIIKWRWDVAVQPDDFDFICNCHIKNKDSFITDELYVRHGNINMNEVVFAARADLMLAAFAPIEDRLLVLGRMIQQDAIKFGKDLQISTFHSFANLIVDRGGNIMVAPFKWALLRKNILDNPNYIECRSADMLIKLQQDGDRQRDKINSSI